jgi:hypothetical protein
VKSDATFGRCQKRQAAPTAFSIALVIDCLVLK